MSAEVQLLFASSSLPHHCLVLMPAEQREKAGLDHDLSSMFFRANAGSLVASPVFCVKLEEGVKVCSPLLCCENWGNGNLCWDSVCQGDMERHSLFHFSVHLLCHPKQKGNSTEHVYYTFPPPHIPPYVIINWSAHEVKAGKE